MRALALLCMVPWALAGVAHAHGINGHVHVTGWAIAELPPGELADFFADPEVRDAALIGAAFPDSGYAIDDPYGELAHWPPFIEAYRVHLRATVGPPFDTLEKRKHAAFWMGMACHGLQDEIFDTIFLRHIAEKDARGQEEADSGTDAFLYVDGFLRFKPPFYAPLDDLVQVFESAHGHVVRTNTVEAGLRRVKLLVIDAFAPSAELLNERLRPEIPWTADHYVDPAIPGSLAAEIPATAAFLEALWARLHDRYPPEQLVVHPYPAPGRRLLGAQAASVDSWVSLVLGAGAPRGDFPERVFWETAAGEPVPFDLFYTRWSSQPDDATRMLQLRPRVDLPPHTRFRVRVAGGATRVDGVASGDWAYEFETRCAPEDPSCGPEPDGGVPPLADAAVPDAASVDGALPDAAPDAGPDAALPDVDSPDAPAVDAGRPDGPVPDAAPDRGLVADASADVGGGPEVGGGGSDGCAAARLPLAAWGPAPWLVGLLLLGFGRRRRP